MRLTQSIGEFETGLLSKCSAMIKGAWQNGFCTNICIVNHLIDNLRTEPLHLLSGDKPSKIFKMVSGKRSFDLPCKDIISISCCLFMDEDQMALRVKSRPVPGLDQLDEFWKEFRAVEESRSPQPSEEEHEEKEPAGECDQEVEWLKEAGFDEVVKKYRDSKEIDPDDAVVQEITSSLTRKQAEAVRKRINTLNDNTKRKLGIPTSPAAPTTSKYNHADVRTIFPVQTNGQPSNSYLSSSTESTNDAPTVPQLINVTSPKTNAKATANIVTVTSSTSAKVQQLSSISRPSLPRRAISEGVSLIKSGGGSSDNFGNLGIAGKYSSLAEVNGHGSYGKEKVSPSRSVPPDDRRGSEDVRVHAAGVQQTKHQHGSVFYVTGLSKQELFNAAEKTKESVVDDLVDPRLNLKDPSVSPGSTADAEPEVIHECPVDVPVDVPVDNYTLTKDELGVTHISDISKQDMEKVRSLALIELTALFDSHGIALHRRKPVKRKVKESGIFGVPLQYMVQHDRAKGVHTKVPIFLQEIINYLEETGLKDEGILRVPGSFPRVKAIKEEIEETFNEGSFSWNGNRPHDVVSLLKQFLRELPFPLLTHEYQPTFASVERADEIPFTDFSDIKPSSE
ncbi:Rho GTPase-activating protein 18 [Exaiptasia diaphana]|nr:Rho GTPase-activating protein 18 [Exaiptasia diaphana]